MSNTDLTKTPLLRMLAAAILAQETNGEYLGANARVPEGKRRNKQWMLQFLQDNDPRIDERMGAAEEMRDYCNSKMLELLKGELTNYWKAILDTLAKEDIYYESHSDWGIIASVPSAYMRAVERDNVQEIREKAKRDSQHFGRPGEQFSGVIRTLTKMFSVKYNKTWYTAITEDGNFVNFPHSQSLIMDRHYEIAGKIRKHGDDNTTLLHYVTIKVDKDATDAII